MTQEVRREMNNWALLRPYGSRKHLAQRSADALVKRFPFYEAKIEPINCLNEYYGVYYRKVNK